MTQSEITVAKLREVLGSLADDDVLALFGEIAVARDRKITGVLDFDNPHTFTAPPRLGPER